MSCVVSGLTTVLDSVSWKTSTGAPITSDVTNYVIEEGSLNDSDNSQTTVLTVVAGVSTDQEYSCVVESQEWELTDQSQTVYLNVYGKNEEQSAQFYIKLLSSP